MRRGTTPTVTFTVSSDDGTALDLTGGDIYVTFEGKGPSKTVEITKSGDDVSAEFEDDATVIRTTLTQEDTLSFKANTNVYAQVKAKIGDTVVATGTVSFGVDEILNEEVI